MYIISQSGCNINPDAKKIAVSGATKYEVYRATDLNGEFVRMIKATNFLKRLLLK